MPKSSNIKIMQEPQGTYTIHIEFENGNYSTQVSVKPEDITKTIEILIHNHFKEE